MENNKIPKVALDAELQGTKKVGRPKLRRLNDTQADLKMTEIEGWRRKAQDQTERMEVIREAKVQLQGM